MWTGTLSLVTQTADLLCGQVHSLVTQTADLLCGQVHSLVTQTADLVCGQVHSLVTQTAYLLCYVDRYTHWLPKLPTCCAMWTGILIGYPNCLLAVLCGQVHSLVTQTADLLCYVDRCRKTHWIQCGMRHLSLTLPWKSCRSGEFTSVSSFSVYCSF